LPFVAGVFASQARADAELAAIPANRHAHCEVGSRADLEFPCLILEAEGHFELVTETEALAVLVSKQTESRLAQSAERDEEPAFLNVYRLAEEFAPRRPGADYMGSIPHWHLSARDLDEVRRHGLSVLWAAGPAHD
jgi:hypothetical protein